MLAHLVAQNLVLSTLHQSRRKVDGRSHHRVLAESRAAADAAKSMAGCYPDAVFDKTLQSPADLERREIGAQGLPFPNEGR
jgi:hypothetical protein